MPPTAESPASSASARPRCTDVVRLIEATAMEVFVQGTRCALNLYSRDGTTRVLMPTQCFLEVARAEGDSNGHPFPMLERVAREERLRQLARDADLHPPPLPPPDAELGLAPPTDDDGNEPPAGISPRDRAGLCYAGAWEYLTRHLDVPVAIAAARCGVGVQGLKKWISANCRGQLRRLRLEARVSQRPQLAPTAAPGAPVLKPNGRIL